MLSPRSRFTRRRTLTRPDKDQRTIRCTEHYCDFVGQRSTDLCLLDLIIIDICKYKEVRYLSYFFVEGGDLLMGEDDPRKPRVPVVFVDC